MTDGIKHFPKRTDRQIHGIVADIHGLLRRVDHWKCQHTSGANNATHCLARWTASGCFLGSPFVFEHSVDMNWLYLGVDAP